MNQRAIRNALALVTVTTQIKSFEWLGFAPRAPPGDISASVSSAVHSNTSTDPALTLLRPSICDCNHSRSNCLQPPPPLPLFPDVLVCIMSLHKMRLILTTEANHGTACLICISGPLRGICEYLPFSSSSPSACTLECPYTSFTRL